MWKRDREGYQERRREIKAAYYQRNKERLKAYTRAHRQAHSATVRATEKASRARHHAERVARERAYKAAHREQQRAYDRSRRPIRAARERHRRTIDFGFRIGQNLRTRLSPLLHGVRSEPILKLLCCTLEELRLHLEAQFQPGMTWGNYGAWHVDHIIPCAVFDLRDKRQQRPCFHFSNLRPLWALANIRKGCE